jgi:uncharacterized protein YbaR (Trm112 family)
MIMGKQEPSTPRLWGSVDRPQVAQRVGDLVEVCGWVLSEPAGPVEVTVAIDGQPIAGFLHWCPRPDVAAAFPALADKHPTPGFILSGINLSHCTAGRHTLAVTAANCGHAVLLGQVEIEVKSPTPFYKTVYTLPDRARQRKKLDLLLPVLACPRCRRTLKEKADKLRCRKCGADFPIVENVPIMIEGEPEYPVEEDKLNSPASNNAYPELITSKLHEVLQGDGLALEVGSGRRHFGAERLIQLEICRYPFTDVVNQGDRLPFRDEAFDFILCLAVTEHVRQPWVLAAEIERVLKKGGSLIVDSAFLQPIHGYPSHFFNMTPMALASLFREVEVSSLKPGRWQHPWFSLRWILSHLLVDLSPPMREQLANLTVEEFVQQLEHFCNDEPNKLDGVILPDHRVSELAAGFTLVGRRQAAKDDKGFLATWLARRRAAG